MSESRLGQSAISPRYEHDCDRCVFLGRQPLPSDPQMDCDVYYCVQAGSIPTVIFRWADDGPEYTSGWHMREALDPALAGRLKEAMRNA